MVYNFASGALMPGTETMPPTDGKKSPMFKPETPAVSWYRR